MRSWTARASPLIGRVSYADIIIETVREPLAVLDRGAANSARQFGILANLEVPREEAEGRLLHEIDDGRWNIPELRERLHALLTDAQPLEDWEVTVDLLVAAPRSFVEREKDPRRCRTHRAAPAGVRRCHGSRGLTAGFSQTASGKTNSSPCWAMSCDIR